MKTPAKFFAGVFARRPDGSSARTPGRRRGLRPGTRSRRRMDKIDGRARAELGTDGAKHIGVRAPAIRLRTKAAVRARTTDQAGFVWRQAAAKKKRALTDRSVGTGGRSALCAGWMFGAPSSDRCFGEDLRRWAKAKCFKQFAKSFPGHRTRRSFWRSDAISTWAATAGSRHLARHDHNRRLSFAACRRAAARQRRIHSVVDRGRRDHSSLESGSDRGHAGSHSETAAARAAAIPNDVRRLRMALQIQNMS